MSNFTGVVFYGNDLRVRLDTLQTSTMAASAYLNSSTGVTAQVWKARTTGTVANRVVAPTNMPYVAASNGRYDLTIQSTQHGLTVGQIGMVIVKVKHSTLDGDWRQVFQVRERGTT